MGVGLKILFAIGGFYTHESLSIVNVQPYHF